MSLILEALRKSEAERRRGQAPDVLADMPVARPSVRRPLSTPTLLAAGVALLALLALGWLLLVRPSPPAATSTAGAGASRPGAAVDAADAADAVVRAPAAAPAPAPGGAPRHFSAGPASAEPASARPVSAEPGRPPAPAADSGGRRASPGDPSGSTSAGSSEAGSDRRDGPPTRRIPTGPPADALRPLPPRAAPDAAAPAAAPAAATPPDARAAPDPGTNDASGAEPLSDLSAPERQALPPLKLSMHLWNADPARRFVILDGRRVREGDRVGEAVVEAIVPDGVVLAWHGRRLMLPIR